VSTNDEQRAVAMRVVRAGVIMLAASVVVGCLPLAWGRSSINKYFVLLGVVGACAGAGCVVQGGIDWVRSRGR
jgi:hypothetical protein